MTSPFDNPLANITTLHTIRKEYSEFLDQTFADSQILAQYQDPEHPIDLDLPLSEAIKKAYPVVEHDEEGKPIDNREQAYINAVKNFVVAMEKNPPSDDDQSKLALAATTVFAGLSTLQEQVRKTPALLASLEGLPEDALQMTIDAMKIPFEASCKAIKDGLQKSDQQRILERGERENHILGRLINRIEDFIDSAKNFFGGLENRSKAQTQRAQSKSTFPPEERHIAPAKPRKPEPPAQSPDRTTTSKTSFRP